MARRQKHGTAAKRNKRGYSTVMIVNKSNPNTKSYTVATKHISRLKYYLTAIAALFVAVIVTLIIFIKKYNQNILAEQELKQFKTEVAGPLATDTVVANAYIKKIESKLLNLKNYLEKRGIKHQLKVGGIKSKGNFVAINKYRYYNKYLYALMKDIKHMPIGYPHANHRHSRYGYRSNPFGGRSREFHSGIDIEGDTGDNVQSTANGKVILAGWYSGYGNCVRVKHEHGYETLYGHLSKIVVKEGQKISAGEEIGKLGSTGRSTGPHLHYEVRFEGKPINPEQFLELL